MEKNLVVAIVASTLFLLVWYRFIAPPAPQPQSVAVRPASAPSVLTAPGTVPVTRISAAPARQETLEAASARLVIDSRGAAVRHWWVWDLRHDKSGRKDAATGVDLVNIPDRQNDLAPADELPLATFPELNFSKVRSSPGESVWRAALPSGLELTKRYAVESGEGSHFVDVSLTVNNPTRKAQKLDRLALGWKGGLGTVGSEEKENPKVTRVLAYPSPERDVVNFKKPAQQAPENYDWVAVDNRYYLLAILPERGAFQSVSAEKSKTNPGQVDLDASLELNPGESKTLSARIYGGPKGYTRLKKLGLHLENAVDFGMFGFLGKWALKALETLRRWTGNYGWAIILMTCFIQLLVLPLSVKSYRSMAAMKKLQPKIQELQKRYKEDPMKLNQEMLALYKASGTNPFGGCLPMVLQIPIFWAFFTMLRNAYELMGAPWILWIHDLSQKDPYYILPVIMGGGMFLQQKISPSSGDPTQAKMMMIMPVVFTFMFMKFPSGLVLYWLTNSILSTANQYWFIRRPAAA